MNTLQWKTADFWNPRKFGFWLNNKTIGQLAFTSLWNQDAAYTDGEKSYKFSEAGLWKQKIVIQHQNQVVALIEKEFFGDYILQLRSGEKYKLVSNFFGKNVRWIDQKGKTVMQYIHESFNSMSKGTIQFKDISQELQALLSSSGIYIQRLTLRRRLAVVMMMVIIVAAR